MATITKSQTATEWAAEITLDDLRRYIVAGINGDLGTSFAWPTGGEVGDESGFIMPFASGAVWVGSDANLTGPIVVASKDVTPA